MRLYALRGVIAAIGLGATWPSWWGRCDQRLALDTLTPKRAAARWHKAPTATAATKRLRKSTDRGEGIGMPLRPSARRPANPSPSAPDQL